MGFTHYLWMREHRWYYFRLFLKQFLLRRHISFSHPERLPDARFFEGGGGLEDFIYRLWWNRFISLDRVYQLNRMRERFSAWLIRADIKEINRRIDSNGSAV